MPPGATVAGLILAACPFRTPCARFTTLSATYPRRPTVWTALVTGRFAAVGKNFVSFLKSPRGARLMRRLVFPVCATALAVALSLAGYARLGGAQASVDNPFSWEGGAAFIAGSTTQGTYTTCNIIPGDGRPRHVDIPGTDGGLRITPWFEGPAEISCGRSVSVTTGPQSALYPLAENQTLIVSLATLAGLSWWLGRGTKAPTRQDHLLGGYKAATWCAYCARIRVAVANRETTIRHRRQTTRPLSVTRRPARRRPRECRQRSN